MAVGTVAEIKGRLPVADVVGETVQLRKAGHDPQGPVPVPWREDGELRRHARPRHLALLRLRQARRHLHVRDGARRHRLSGGAEGAGRASRRRDRRAHEARGCPSRPPARGHGGRDRLLPRRPAALEAGRAGPRVPARSRLHRRHDRAAAAGLGARGLGPAGPPARVEAPRVRRRAPRGRPGQPAPARRRRLRPLPRAGDLPDPRRQRASRRSRRARPRQGGRRRGRAGPRAEVPELPGDAAVRQEPDAVPHRPGEVGDPQERPGRDRRGLHRRPDGPPGRVRQRRRVARAPRSRPGRSR